MNRNIKLSIIVMKMASMIINEALMAERERKYESRRNKCYQ